MKLITSFAFIGSFPSLLHSRAAAKDPIIDAVRRQFDDLRARDE